MRGSRLVAGAVAAVVATAVHDSWEFGVPSRQNSLPFALAVAVLLGGWYRAPDARALVVRMLRIVASVLLIGGAVASALPLPIWPWHPEPTAEHYIVHAVWAAGLIALLVATAGRATRQRGVGSRVATSPGSARGSDPPAGREGGA
jgi:hypothetical protein